MAIEPIELEGQGVERRLGAEIHFADLRLADGTVIPRAEDEPLLLAGLRIMRLLLHDPEVVDGFTGEEVVVADDMDRGHLQFGEAFRQVESRPEAVRLGMREIGVEPGHVPADGVIHLAER